MIVALEVPLALNVERRAIAELEAQSLAQAQTVATSVADSIDARPRLARLVDGFGRDSAGRDVRRVIVVDEDGILLADSARVGLTGERYATPDRPEIVTALDERIPETRIGESDTLDQEILATAVPVISDGRLQGAVRVSQSTEPLRAGVRRAILGLVAVGLAALLAGVAIAFVIAGALAKPLARLAGAARRFGEGDLSARSPAHDAPSEIGQVAGAFNDMAARVQAMVRAQQGFAANVSHQLRTPLTAIKLRLEAAKTRAREETSRRDLEAAESEVDRLAQIVERLLLLARRTESSEPSEVEIGRAALDATERWRSKAAQAGASLTVTGDDARALCDRRDVDQILDNLIDNAISYAGGPITIETRSSNGWAVLAVDDAGPGVAEDEVALLAERFYRGRDAPPGGSGLGLAIVKELTTAWGGTLDIAPRADGTRVEVRLPAAEP